jgi:microcystin-dependent protein
MADFDPDVTLPHTFVDGPGNTASGEQVMENLEAIIAKFSDLTAGFLGRPGDLKATVDGASVPSGWLLCDGSAISRTTYSALWTAIRNGHAGTGGDPAPYGNGDGATTFNLPDFRGRVLPGSDPGIGRIGSGGALGEAGGDDRVALTGADLPLHVSSNDSGALLGEGGTPSSYYAGNNTIAGATQLGLHVNQAGSAPTQHENMPPYQTVQWLVKH